MLFMLAQLVGNCSWAKMEWYKVLQLESAM